VSDRPRLVFMGTPDFAATALRALIDAGHEILAAYTQPPRPAGRGHKLQPSPVQILAEANGIPVHSPVSLRKAPEQEAFRDLGADIGVVAAYGLILPRAILDAPRLGCLNIHGSLLPRWRGAAPIQRAMLAGDAETGITVMRMDAGLDTGPMLTKGVIPITPATTGESLHDAMAEMGARMIVEALPAFAAGRLTEIVQPEEGVTYAAKLTRADGDIDWRNDAIFIERQIRALNPRPGCRFAANGEVVAAISATLVPDAVGTPGQVLDDRLTVACGSGGGVRLDRVRRPGKGAVEGSAFLRGFALPPGSVLETMCPSAGN